MSKSDAGIQQGLDRVLSQQECGTSWSDFMDYGSIVASHGRLPGESLGEQCTRLWSDDVAWVRANLPQLHIQCSTGGCTRNADKFCVAPRFDATSPTFDPKCSRHKRRQPWDMWWRTEAESDGCAGWLQHWTEHGCAGVGERFVRALRNLERQASENAAVAAARCHSATPGSWPS
jgi:hypothetical protein